MRVGAEASFVSDLAEPASGRRSTRRPAPPIASAASGLADRRALFWELRPRTPRGGHRVGRWAKMPAVGSDDAAGRRQAAMDLCAARPGAVEDYPFGDAVAVWKVAGKMFALVGLDDDPPSVSLKCDPALAEERRARHPAVRPGYHLNKRHWNTVVLDGSLDDEVAEMVEHSYRLVVAGLSRRERDALATGPS